jgi:hypothetical protein
MMLARQPLRQGPASRGVARGASALRPRGPRAPQASTSPESAAVKVELLGALDGWAARWGAGALLMPRGGQEQTDERQRILALIGKRAGSANVY